MTRKLTTAVTDRVDMAVTWMAGKMYVPSPNTGTSGRPSTVSTWFNPGLVATLPFPLQTTMIIYGTSILWTFYYTIFLTNLQTL